MSISLEDATARLRAELLGGAFAPGVKLREVSIAERLNVSRTITRLAMGALEHEGLLVREPNRGSRTRAFTIDEIADAIEVRGELEAMAVRSAAERGLKRDIAEALEDCLKEAETLLSGEIATDEEREKWVTMNVRFHETIVKASGNWALQVSIAQISNLPLVDTTAIIFDRLDLQQGWRQLSQSHADHSEIYRAMQAHQGHRAEALMREHAFRNARNKRVNLASPETMKYARKLPGGALIVSDDQLTYLRKEQKRRTRAANGNGRV